MLTPKGRAVVKRRNRPTTPIESRPPATSGELALSDACPPLQVEVFIIEGASVYPGDPVSAHVRDQRVQLRTFGQVVARLEDGPQSQTIIQCHEAGRRYEGHVRTLEGTGAVITLESHR